ncbi:hypothetical protein [Francisella tularensis]|uniref:hypothetical protein n=1 Tax=Francisella tularensis TaxID=263 RepID=UPI0012BB06B2|nr:hypothetical protein [Francisella tularensis]
MVTCKPGYTTKYVQGRVEKAMVSTLLYDWELNDWRVTEIKEDNPQINFLIGSSIIGGSKVSYIRVGFGRIL